MPDSDCSDMQSSQGQQHRNYLETVGGPSFRLLGSLPMFKARKKFNKRLESEDSTILENKDETSVSVFGASQVASGRATSASAPVYRSTAHRGSSAKLKTRKSPPSLPTTMLPLPADGRLRAKPQRVGDKEIPNQKGARSLFLATDAKKSSSTSLTNKRQVATKPALASAPKPPQPAPPQVRLLKQEIFKTELFNRQLQQKSRRMRPPKRDPQSMQEGPINYMQVYHRLRKGRFGFLYDYSAYGATSSSSPARHVGRGSVGIGSRKSPLTLEFDTSAVAPSASASTSCTSLETVVQPKVTAPLPISPSSDGDTADKGRPTLKVEGTSLAHHLLRLLQDGDHINVGQGRVSATAPGAASTVVAKSENAVLTAISAFRPVPKPRKSTSQASKITQSGPTLGGGAALAYAIVEAPASIIGSYLTPETGAGVTSVIASDVQPSINTNLAPAGTGAGVTSVMEAEGTSTMKPIIAGCQSAPKAAAASGANQRVRQSTPLSVTTFSTSYFASTSVLSSEPIDPPRFHHLSPMLVIPSTALEHASVAWRSVRYRCVSLPALQRLSVTGLLLGKGDPAARCRWLGSSALLTHLRFPTRVELPARFELTKGDKTCASATPADHLDAMLNFSISIDPPEARFAFKAMRWGRASRVRDAARSGSGGVQGSAFVASSMKKKSNFYAVPVG